MRRFLLLSVPPAVLLTLAAARISQEPSLADRARALFEPIPASPPALEDNAVTPERTELGKMLYFEPRLSSSWLISCNTCHNLGFGGVDQEETSVGHGWQRGPRNAPTVLNAVFNVAQFWDGRARDLEEQAKGPIQAGVEMNSTPGRTLETLRSMPGYVERFEAAFPADDDPVSFENVARAIEVFEATLLTPDAPFDRFLRGDAGALDGTEKRGLRLFMDRGCSSCHRGVNVGGQGYFPFGVTEKPGAEILPPGDRGRFEVTKTASDEYVFKAPALRNVRLTAPYFHSGSVWELKRAVAVMGSAQLGATLSGDEVTAIAAFLATLTGEQPEVRYPTLPPISAETPRPYLEAAAFTGEGE